MVHYGRWERRTRQQEASLLSKLPPTPTQQPRFLDRFRTALQIRGRPPEVVEVSVPQVGILPAPDFQLPLPFGFGHVDTHFLQAPPVLRAVPGIDDVKGPVALVEALLDEGEEHPVLLFLPVEEGADVPGAVEDRTRQRTCFGWL